MLEIKEKDSFKNARIIFLNNKKLESKEALAHIRKKEKNAHSKKSIKNI